MSPGSPKSQGQIGSFRDSPELKKLLPEKLFRDLFDDFDVISSDASTITVNNPAAFLNNGAFGRSYDKVQDVSNQLRRFADSNPDVFYDQVCLQLVRHSSRVASEFFGTSNILLVPNCTIAMKSILETLVKKNKDLVAAYLAPLYGATQKLLQCFKNEGLLCDVVEISPGGEMNSLVEEDPKIILQHLKDSFQKQKFDILFCDETASQSGRILPLEVVTRFCRMNGVTVVVDGTQSCQLLLTKNKSQILDDVDYFVMSTHKWLGNVKTCGIIRLRDGVLPPDPPGISFGWEPLNSNSGDPSMEEAQARFLWIGMQDSYIAYISLAKAIQIFSHYGEDQARKASVLLNDGLRDVLKVEPLLADSYDKVRVMNIFRLQNAQFETMRDVPKIQNALQDYGVYVSVKKFGRDCGSTSSETVCSRKDKFYLRVSCWSYNNKKDFETLSFALNNNLRLSTLSNEALKHQFTYIYDLYDKLFSVLEPEAFFIRAEPLRHHLIFYYGHTSVFYVNKLFVSGHLPERINARLESTLSVGVDEMSWDDLLEDNYDWSKMSDEEKIKFLETVKNYRKNIRQLVLDLIDQNPVETPIKYESLQWILIMGMEHEKIHLETSAVIIAQVPTKLIKNKHNFNFPTYFDEKGFSINDPILVPENCLIPVPGGKINMGKDHLEQDIYGWDNEFGHESRDLVAFTASQMLVSNAEYLKFVNDGGYTENGKKWWSPEGWRYVNDMKVTGPRFWIGKTHYRILLKEIPMPWNFPVEVNNLEAEAFCKWKSEKLGNGKTVRLISYEESFHMRNIAKNETNNHNLNKFASPTPVNLYCGEINGNLIYDICGNVWRHSASVLTVMDGFKVDPFYDDFTLPTIDGHHNHVVGGSWISLGNCANLNARYGFRRHFYQFAGIRYVCSDNDYHKKVPKIFDGNLFGKQITESYKDFTEELQVEEKPVKNWPKLLGQTAADVINKESKIRNSNQKLKVMVVHGSAGRITLEILRNCSNLNIDHTNRTANNLQVLETLLDESKIQWYQQIEGAIEEPFEFLLDDSESNGKLLQPKDNTVNFWQADYRNIRPFLNSYDIIVADFRYNNSAEHIEHISHRLNSGGLLILGSIDDPHDQMFGPKHSLAVLEKKFEREETFKLKAARFPHIYQQTRNKYQYAISNISFWRKLAQERESTVMEPEITKVDDDETPASTKEYYEDKSILLSYDKFHFGEGLLSVNNFPLAMAEICINASKRFNIRMQNALDAGCGPGRTALELSAAFQYVEAYDYSEGFVDMLQKKAKKHNITNLLTYQGDGHMQTEICKVKEFDLIHASNLIDRLHTPKTWLLQSKALLRQGGLLVISSPYTWMKEHTQPENWIGGYKKNGENYFTLDGLKELLGPELVLLEFHRIPFVIPDDDGTFQYTFSNCTVFGAKGLKDEPRTRLQSESQG